MSSEVNFYKGLFDNISSKLVESYNQDGFPNSEELQNFFIELGDLPDEIEVEGKKYVMTYYGDVDSQGRSVVYYTDMDNDDSDIKVFYTLEKQDNGSYKGIQSIDGVSDLRESCGSTESELKEEDKEEEMSDQYKAGMELRDKIVNSYWDNDLESAYKYWCELYDLYPVADKSEEERVKSFSELNKIMDTIEDEVVYGVTDYGKEKSYKEMGY